MAGRDLVIQWAKDLRRAIDYLETRKDIDSKRLAYFGRSLGAIWGPVMTAVEPRIKASVLLAGGLPFDTLPDEIDPINFAPTRKSADPYAQWPRPCHVPSGLVAKSTLPTFGCSGLPKAPRAA